jgi:redox-sensitive bicupin YhaK (pirin superfamily)
MKKLSRVHRAGEGHWVGDGFPVRSMMSYNTEGAEISPFLLLDMPARRSFRPRGRAGWRCTASRLRDG